MLRQIRYICAFSSDVIPQRQGSTAVLTALDPQELLSAVVAPEAMDGI
jgi:hypothetical protein